MAGRGGCTGVGEGSSELDDSESGDLNEYTVYRAILW